MSKKQKYEDSNEEERKNLLERLWFVKYWAEYIKSHEDKEWSEQQKDLIDSQFN